MSGSPTADLAEFVVRSRWDDVPDEVRQEAVRTLSNWVGCALGGATEPAVDIAVEVFDELSGPRLASLFGRGERLDPLRAAFVNGLSSHVLDFDDTHLDTIIHPAGPVAPALFALAERQPEGVSGARLLHALVLGVDVACRIGLSVYPSHYDRGFHITGTAGVFGSAAAAGKLLGLDERAMIWALGIAATQSSGLREMFGTMCKPFHPGRAAENGLAAALLASRGFTSSEQALEAPRGFASVLSDDSDLSVITADLGERFEILRNSYKPFACGVVIHPAIDACVQLRDRLGLVAHDVERVELSVHPLVLELTGKTSPTTGLEGKFSVYHSVAVALIRGVAGAAEYTDDAVADPEVVALRGRVVATVDASIREDACRARIRLRDGRVVEQAVEHAVGSRERPMSDEALDAKFKAQAERVLPTEQAEALLALCRGVESLADAGEIPRIASLTVRPDGKS